MKQKPDTTLHVDRFLLPDGLYATALGERGGDGIYEKPEYFIAAEFLGIRKNQFMRNALEYVRDVLRHIISLKTEVMNIADPMSGNRAYSVWRAKGESLFPGGVNGGAAAFVFAILSARGLLKSDDIIPGTLTEKGRELLEDLECFEFDKPRPGFQDAWMAHSLGWPSALDKPAPHPDDYD